MNMSQASYTTPSSFEENDEIRTMVAERERNFFKEISMNPQLKDQHPAGFDQHFLAQSFKSFMLKARVKNDYYNDEARLKISCTTLAPIDFAAESRNLLQEINALRAS